MTRRLDQLSTMKNTLISVIATTYNVYFSEYQNLVRGIHSKPCWCHTCHDTREICLQLIANCIQYIAIVCNFPSTAIGPIALQMTTLCVSDDIILYIHLLFLKYLNLWLGFFFFFCTFIIPELQLVTLIHQTTVYFGNFVSPLLAWLLAIRENLQK